MQDSGSHETVGRLVTFVDAGVAIALTLLILPLMEAVTELHAERAEGVGAEATTSAYLSDNAALLGSFALSFAVIGVFWMVHHRTLREDTPYTARLARVNLVWLFTIVCLPVATALVGELESDRAQVAVYVGTMAASSGALVWLTAEVRRARRKGGLEVGSRAQYAGPLAAVVLFVLALAVGLVVPGRGYWGLLLLVLNGAVQRLLARWLDRA